MQPRAFFLPAPGGQRFCIFHAAQGDAMRGNVLYVHPFAEEMNKSRRMAALQARALARAGYAVLQIDLLGCGDSSGDFSEASWSAWIDDILLAQHWLKQQGTAPLWLWGLRAGCLLAVDAARQLPDAGRFLFWAPTAAGKPLLQQFLRLKTAGDALEGKAKGAMDSLRQTLAAGGTVDVAGYSLPAAVSLGLESATLSPPNGAERLEWLELSSHDDAELSPVAQKALLQWQQASACTRSHLVRGPAFWQTTEIEDAPALLQATLQALDAPVIRQAA